MEKEISQLLNSELIQKISSLLYGFAYLDEKPAQEELVIVRYEDFKIHIELLMQIEKTSDDIISNCQIRATVTQETKKISRHNAHE